MLLYTLSSNAYKNNPRRLIVRAVDWNLKDPGSNHAKVHAIFIIQTFYEDGSGSSEDSSNGKLFPQDHLAAIIGDENIHHCPTLIHLVLTDSVYTDDKGSNIDKEGVRLN